jgi:DNA-binding HxlR family transcriptional regulator
VKSHPASELSKILHHRLRLGIMSMLTAEKEADFNDLLRALTTSRGSLSVQLRTLEDHGLIALKRTGAGRSQRSTYRITEQGAEQFREYLAVLEQIVRKAKSS